MATYCVRIYISLKQYAMAILKLEFLICSLCKNRPILETQNLRKHSDFVCLPVKSPNSSTNTTGIFLNILLIFCRENLLIAEIYRFVNLYIFRWNLKKKYKVKCSILLIERFKCEVLSFLPSNFLKISFSR